MTGWDVCVATAAVLMLLVGCTAGSKSSAPTPEPPSAVEGGPPVVATAPITGPPLIDSQFLPCGDSIDNRPPPPDWQVVRGVVGLPTSPRADALQTGLTGEPSPALRLFAKTGLVIKTGVKFELVVSSPTGNRVGIGWGNGPFTPSHRVVVNCPDVGGTGWLAYAGGYWLDHPACIPLTVRLGAREQSVAVGLGTPCPGQRPPQGPSDR
jgi:hypothetical protein